MNFFTELKEGLWISWDAIRANKMRSVLTTLGIVIGIVTVTLMGTAIQGLDRAFLTSISSLGTDVLYVQRFGWFINSYEDWMKVQKRRKITMPQVRAVEKQMTLARAVAPHAFLAWPAKTASTAFSTPPTAFTATSCDRGPMWVSPVLSVCAPLATSRLTRSM